MKSIRTRFRVSFVFDLIDIERRITLRSVFFICQISDICERKQIFFVKSFVKLLSIYIFEVLIN